MYRDPDKQREFQRRWVADRRSEFFVGKACVLCSSTESLELDHIDRTTKVTNSVWSWASERREAEIAKCQVLCKACHAAKTAGELRALFQRGQCNGINRGAYRKGCRCDQCKIANKMYMRQWKRSKAG